MRNYVLHSILVCNKFARAKVTLCSNRTSISISENTVCIELMRIYVGFRAVFIHPDFVSFLSEALLCIKTNHSR